jgi:organic hydroperoxide reductase OsmC/OhrA
LLTSETSGEVEKDGKVLIIKRIHVTYHLKTAVENRETAVRVHDFHADFCPVARSIRDSIQITTALQFVEA